MDIADDLAAQVNELARQEPPTPDLQCEPVHAKRYFSLLGGHVDFGPAFTFPERMAPHSEVVTISDVAPLLRHFRGWSAVEIPERSPIVAIVDEGYAISVCFCARRSAAAAEAGVETAEQFRGRGLASRVTAAWALAIRATSRTPLYSTSWSNKASLGLAKKLSLYPFASDWSLSD